jgi:hypothetical protein
MHEFYKVRIAHLCGQKANRKEDESAEEDK